MVSEQRDHFKVCPQCESPNLVRFEGETICGFCGWDTIGLRVEAELKAKENREWKELNGPVDYLGRVRLPLRAPQRWFVGTSHEELQQNIA
jgi:hypothetical protein